jgi:hypothetical protein
MEDRLARGIGSHRKALSREISFTTKNGGLKAAV